MQPVNLNTNIMNNRINNFTHTNHLIKNLVEKVEHLKGFKVKFLGATDNLRRRVKITDTRLKNSVTISWDDSYNSIKDIAIEYLISHQGINIVSFTVCEYSQQYTLLTDDFTSELKQIKRGSSFNTLIKK